MASYSYIAINKLGKELKGTVSAESQTKASEELKKGGLTIVSLGEVGALSKDISFGFMDKKPKPRDLSVFCRQFVSIVGTGISVISALEMLGEETENKRLRRAIINCKRSIEKGESLASAMGENRDVFSDIFITMVEAGEASGSLDVSFTRMADQFEKDAKLKATVKKATIYPTVVAVIAVAVVIGMLTFVIPSFQDMFDQMGTELPGITKAVIAASKFMQKFWFIAIGGIVGLVIVFRLFAASDPGKHLFGRLSMKIPLFGKLTVKTASARMARTLSTLLAAGIPLIEALEITAGVMTNVYFREDILDAKDDVAMGNSLSEPLERTGLFPPLVTHMLKIGEETGNIEGMLNRLADYYDEEVEAATAQMMAAMEPLIIVVMAVVIGTIIMSVIAPMGALYTNLDNL